jgi:hypothetical protein
MIQANYADRQTPQLRVLSDAQCQTLFRATLECLNRVGVEVHNAAARDLLRRVADQPHPAGSLLGQRGGQRVHGATGIDQGRCRAESLVEIGNEVAESRVQSPGRRRLLAERLGEPLVETAFLMARHGSKQVFASGEPAIERRPRHPRRLGHGR